MEPIIHATPTRRKTNSAKVNLVISIAFHALLLGGAGFWAAHEGVLGNRMKEFAATIIPKEKKPEPEKQPEPKFEAPTKVETPRPVEQQVAAAPAPVAPSAAPPSDAAPAAPDAPPAMEIPGGFSFGEPVTLTDPVSAYKSYVERTLRTRWQRPEGLNDAAYTAEVELRVDPSGNLTDSQWKKGSGNQRWDDSIRTALTTVKSVNRPRPTGFPETFLVRFDVVAEEEVALGGPGDALQAGIR
jgi:outer membrane biosynthesis protein TonB